jgi:ATP-dependent Lhr-like helicase
MHHRREIGQVDQSMFFSNKTDEAPQRVLLLAGRTWWVDSIAWSKKIVYVEPLDLPGNARWRGDPPPTTAALAEAHRRVLRDDALGAQCYSKRATEQLAEIRLEFEFLEPEGDCWIDADALECWNFAGTRRNALLSARIEEASGKAPRFDPLRMVFDEKSSVVARAFYADAQEATGHPPVAADHPGADSLKFKDLLPDELVGVALAARMFE